MLDDLHGVVHAADLTIQSAAGDPILIDGIDPFHGLDVNAAMIFDSNIPTGGDDDLEL